MIRTYLTMQINNTEKFPVVDGDEDEQYSVEDMEQDGYRVHSCLVAHDGHGSFMILIEKGGVKKWQPISLDQILKIIPSLS